MSSIAPFPSTWHGRLHSFAFGEGNDADRDIYSFLFGSKACWGALAFLCLLGVLPADGAGIQVCLFRYVTGLPCPGCGLTRSCSSILHLHFLRAYDYHPFGFLALPLFVAGALLIFLPAGTRDRWENWLRKHDAIVRRAYMTSLYGFIAFGSIRIAVYAILGLHAL